MAAGKPILYIRNALKLALDGSGDGTALAVATAAPNQHRAFYGLDAVLFIADLGADAPDLLKGRHLVFPTGRYPLTGWTVPAAGPGTLNSDGLRFTISAPFDLDEGDYLMLTSGPQSGQVRKLTRIPLNLADLIDERGFEGLAVGAFPSTEQAPGIWYGDSAWAVSATAPIDGSRMAVLTVPASGDKDLTQRCIGSLVAGRRYRLAFSARAVTGATLAGGLRALVVDHATGATVWSVEIPAIGTTAASFAAELVPDVSVAAPRLILRAVYANRGSATALHLDNVYAYEQTPPGTVKIGPWVIGLASPFTTNQAAVSYQRRHRAFVSEVPDVSDSGACTVRTLLDDRGDLAVDGVTVGLAPLAVDGCRFTSAKVRAANVALTLDAHLPNLLGQAGFEELTAGALPATEQAPGIWWSTAGITVSATTPLLGSRMAVWDTLANDTLQERLVGTLKKGKTYRLIMKVQAVGGATATDALRATVVHRVSGANIDADFGGAGSWNHGILGASAAWITSPNLVPDVNTDMAKLTLSFLSANKGTATGVRIDECYLWEVVNVASLVAFGHNWDGSPGPSVTGYRCSPSRTGVAADDYSVLLASVAVAGSAPVRSEFTAGIFPIYRIQIAASAAYRYQVDELLLGERWAWGSAPRLGMDPQARDYRETRLPSLAGVQTRVLFSNLRTIKGELAVVSALDASIWDGIFRERHVEAGEVFAAYWPGQWDALLLLKHVSLRMPYNRPPRPDVSFEWTEAL